MRVAPQPMPAMSFPHSHFTTKLAVEALSPAGGKIGSSAHARQVFSTQPFYHKLAVEALSPAGGKIGTCLCLNY